MKLAGVLLLLLVAVLTSVHGSPLATDNLIVNLAVTLVFLWLIVRWVRRSSAVLAPRLSTPTAYREVIFRSATEAAWAERFDRDGVPWLYEAQWFRLRRNGRRIDYLRDDIRVAVRTVTHGTPWEWDRDRILFQPATGDYGARSPGPDGDRDARALDAEHG